MSPHAPVRGQAGSAPSRRSSTDSNLSTLRFMAGNARRALDAHDRRTQRSETGPANAGAGLERAARLTQNRFAAARARRRVQPVR